MGSLPNLHELATEGGGEEAAEGAGFRPGPALGRLCGGAADAEPPTLTPEEKSKILHRYSGHGRVNKSTRPNVAPPQTDVARHVYDDTTLEHMAAYSPISSRSSRHLNNNTGGGNHPRRRDSLSSSIGATSVRRLLATVVRPGPSSRCSTNPLYTRRALLRNLAVLCVLNLLLTATYLPFVALQASVSVWSPPPNADAPVDVNVGSLLLCLLYLCACPSALLGPALVQRLGANLVVCLSLLAAAAFHLAHLRPQLYSLVPACVWLGLCAGPLASACTNYLMTVGAKLCYAFSEEDEDTRTLRRTCVVRRVARAFRASHDLGLILGSALSALVITYTVNLSGGLWTGYLDDRSPNATVPTVVDSIVMSCVNSTPTSSAAASTAVFANCTGESRESAGGQQPYDYNAFLDDIFDTFEGARLCGAQACPAAFPTSFNATDEEDDEQERQYRVLPPRTASALAAAYAGGCLVALLVAALCLDRVRMYVYQDPLERSEGMAALRAVRDTFKDAKLQMAAPLAVFIGLEQAFIYADFSKSYVVCTLGIHRLNLVFLSMGLLQSIAACTLSMLLRSIRRYYVVAVGLAFHACLIMVLVLWKPIEDDPALFYVISASWGVCNAIWEMLNFTLLTGLYTDNWEAAFANATFFRFVGLTVGFGVHGLLCNYTKLYALAAALAASVVPFAWLEARLESQRKVRNITRL